MGEKTGIEWTDSTWNPATGCTQVTRGCDNCYALTLAHRRLSEAYLARVPANNIAENRTDPFAVRLWPERLEQPRKWRSPRMVFVNSMSDLFHADIPDAFVRSVFEVMLEVDRHVYQVLTKRPSRAARFCRKNMDLFPNGVVPPHIWMGTSIEDQQVDYRARHLRAVPAVVRFLSCEPLLGPLEIDLEDIDWVIVGGESGPGFRPMNLEWARDIRDECQAFGVPFFFKQIGGFTPKAGGRLLHGVEWNEMPRCVDTSSERKLALV